MDGVLGERARRVAEVRLAPMATRLAHVRGVAAAAERLVERIAGRGTVEMRVGDERVVGAEHRRVQQRGMCADLQSGDARNWLQACEGHPAAPRKVGADLLLLAALRDRV